MKGGRWRHGRRISDMADRSARRHEHELGAAVPRKSEVALIKRRFARQSLPTFARRRAGSAALRSRRASRQVERPFACALSRTSASSARSARDTLPEVPGTRVRPCGGHRQHEWLGRPSPRRRHPTTNAEARVWLAVDSSSTSRCAARSRRPRPHEPDRTRSGVRGGFGASTSLAATRTQSRRRARRRGCVVLLPPPPTRPCARRSTRLRPSAVCAERTRSRVSPCVPCRTV